MVCHDTKELHNGPMHALMQQCAYSAGRAVFIRNTPRSRPFHPENQGRNQKCPEKRLRSNTLSHFPKKKFKLKHPLLDYF